MFITQCCRSEDFIVIPHEGVRCKVCGKSDAYLIHVNKRHRTPGIILLLPIFMILGIGLCILIPALGFLVGGIILWVLLRPERQN